MKTLFLAAVLLAVSTGASFAIDDASLAVAQSYKPKKQIKIEDVAVLMRGADYWCYKETSDGCDWGERYLDVGAETATYEVSNAWDETRDIAFTDVAEFRDGRFICENGYDYIPSVYGHNRQSGEPIFGRELAGIKAEMVTNNAGDTTLNCFDYVFGSVDAGAGIITITQRQFIEDGTTDPANDAVVTLHFDTTDAPVTLLNWDL